MLRIKIDLVPLGHEPAATQIGEMIIANVFTSVGNIAEYIYAYKDSTHGEVFGNLRGFDRSRGAWELIYECLNSDDFDLREPDKALLRDRFSEI